MKKFNYVLNHYSDNESSHFAHVANLLNEIAKNDCEINLIIEKCSGNISFDTNNISVHVLKNRSPISRRIELFLLLRQLIKNGSAKTFVRITAITSIVSTLAHFFYGGKSYLWQSGTTYEYDWALKFGLKKIKWILSSHLPNWFARLIVHNFVTGPEPMIKYYNEVVGVNRNKIVLLYNDIDLSKFSGGNKNNILKIKKELNIDVDKKIMILVHRLSPVRKTNMYLNEIFADYKKSATFADWVFVIVGDGDELPEAKKLVKKYDLEGRVKFTGAIPNKLLGDYYGMAQIFVHPTFTEGFPRVVIEAMSVGLPIVSTNAGGMESIVGSRQLEFVYDKNDPKKFSEGLGKLISSPYLWEDLGEENILTVQKYSTEKVAQMYIKEIFK